MSSGKAVTKIQSAIIAVVIIIAVAASLYFYAMPTPTPTPTPTPLPSPTPQRTIVVTSTADSGPGTLRRALLEAQSGDTITFDPTVFLPTAPATIYISSELPFVTQGNLTFDGSDTGVILDGSQISEGWVPGLQLISDGNTVHGLQILNFSGAGIVLSGGAQHNTIGGDRSIGSGPLGQGNLVGNGDIGIGLWGEGTSFNTITGNLIGIDATGAVGLSNNKGIWITEGASYNIIGPDNIIAYNNAHGIEVQYPNSFGNTIMQNSIHDNGGEGIYLVEGGNRELLPLIITDFDLSVGTLTGATYANCTVEIFSDSGDEGQIYEGRTTADGFGVFTFVKGTSITGPHLTATTTDEDGNTSEFSVSTSGTRRSTYLQEGNNLPKTQLQPKKSRELEDNRIGTGGAFERTPLLPHPGIFLDQVNNVGQKWILELTIDWLEWEPVETTGDYSTYNIDPTHDEAITGLANLGIEMVYSLAFWDEEIEPEEGYARFKKEDEIQRYLDYVQFLVHNFKDRIQYYGMIIEPRFNEDPHAPFNQQNIELVDYINLVNRSVQVIRQEYPEAKIGVGANVLFYDRDYLFGILESDIMPLVDAVSWHPMFGTSPEYQREYYYNYPSIVQEIKDVASAHGFKGEYIADSMDWRTPLNPHPDQPLYSETVSAKYYARGIMMHLGMNVIAGYAGISLDLQSPKMRVIRNLCTIMAGAEPVSLPVEIQCDATNMRSYSFSLTTGDALIALWTDGVAVDEDPGVKANLTFSGFTAQDVMGIDILGGFQQPIIASSKNGNLIIENLIVKDYPLIIRISAK